MSSATELTDRDDRTGTVAVRPRRRGHAPADRVIVLDALSPNDGDSCSFACLGLLLVTDQRDCRHPGALDVGDTRPQSEPGPVLLVPGYGGNVNSLEPVAAALRSAGRTAMVVTPPGDGTGDLRASGHIWAMWPSASIGQWPTSVDVVGYSAGGVVARLWVRDKGGVDLARRVLTLGSPHHGTTQAALGAEFAGGCRPRVNSWCPTVMCCADSTPVTKLPTDRFGRPSGRHRIRWSRVESAAWRSCQHPDSRRLSRPPLLPMVIFRVTRSVLAALGSVLGVEPPHSPTGVRC